MAIQQIENDLIANRQAQISNQRIALTIVRSFLRKHFRRLNKFVKDNDTENVPVDTLLDKTVWMDMYVRLYTTIGVREAKREYRNQKRLDGQGEKAWADLGMLVDIWSGRLKEMAVAHALKFEGRLNEVSEKLVREALGKTHELGLDRTGRVRIFLKSMTGIVNRRSKPITRTETTTIAAIGKEVGARQWINESNEEGYRLWFGRVVGERPEHLELNDTIIPIDENYIMAGRPCARPGDLSLPAKLRINCRCSESFMTAGRYRQYEKRGMIVNGKIVN